MILIYFFLIQTIFERAEKVWKGRLEKHSEKLGEDKDGVAGGEPRAEVFPPAGELQGEQRVQEKEHTRYHRRKHKRRNFRELGRITLHFHFFFPCLFQ